MSAVITIVGAESTGKSVLSRNVANRLGAAWVGEYLREWCEREGRTPQPDEQPHIAAEQRRRIESAAAAHPLVVADTTPLVTAVYSDFIFDDRSLYADAIAWQRAHASATLLTGMDTPWLQDSFIRDGPHARVPVDRLLRKALQDAGLEYALVYGDGEERIQCALRAVARLLPAPPVEDAGAPFRPRCAECLDPACERLSHRRT